MAKAKATPAVKISREAVTARNKERRALQREVRNEKRSNRNKEMRTGMNPVTGKEYFVFSRSGNVLNSQGSYQSLAVANMAKEAKEHYCVIEGDNMTKAKARLAKNSQLEIRL